MTEQITDADSLAARMAAVDAHLAPLGDDPADPQAKALRDALADALSHNDTVGGYDDQFTDDWENDPKTRTYVDGLMAVVSPMLHRLRAERDGCERLWQLAVQDAARTAGQNDTMKRQRDVARFRVHRVRELHEKVEGASGPYCDVCSGHGDVDWPCATVHALDDNIRPDADQEQK